MDQSIFEVIVKWTFRGWVCDRRKYVAQGTLGHDALSSLCLEMSHFNLPHGPYHHDILPHGTQVEKLKSQVTMNSNCEPE